MMKILSVVPDLNAWGGIQKMARMIHDALADDFDLELVNWKATFPFSLKGFLKYLPPPVAGALYDRFFSTHFEEAMSPGGADLIHFWHPEGALSAGSILRRGEPYVVTCLGLEILPGNLRGFRRKAYTDVLHRARLIHAISVYTRDLIINLFQVPPERIRLIHPPIEYDLLASQPTARGPGTIIGSLTRLQRRKNIPNVIRALELLAQRGDLSFTYYLSGDGPERKAILDELKRVSFPWKYFGTVSEECKRTSFYPALDLFVMSPLSLSDEIEGFGIVYLEANAYGIPVIASRSGGVEDAVKEGVSGEFADPEQPEEIAAAMLRVLRDRERYSETARQWARRFDFAIAAERFEDFYREAAGGSCR